MKFWSICVASCFHLHFHYFFSLLLLFWVCCINKCFLVILLKYLTKNQAATWAGAHKETIFDIWPYWHRAGWTKHALYLPRAQCLNVLLLLGTRVMWLLMGMMHMRPWHAILFDNHMRRNFLDIWFLTRPVTPSAGRYHQWPILSSIFTVM